MAVPKVEERRLEITETLLIFSVGKVVFMVKNSLKLFTGRLHIYPKPCWRRLRRSRRPAPWPLFVCSCVAM